MSRKSSPPFLRGLVGATAGTEVLAMALIFFFTKSLIYCIISLAGAAIGITSFLVLIRQTDRILEKGKGKMMFFLTGLAKLLVIAGTFFVVSRLDQRGAIFFVQGLVMIYLALVGAGIMRLFKKRVHGT